MSLYSQLKHTKISFILIWVLIVPNMLQFAHVLEEHNHTICKEVSVHLHEAKWDCSLCDFNLSSFNFDFISPTLSEDPIAYSYLSIPYIEAEKIGISSLIFLRGPPLFT